MPAMMAVQWAMEIRVAMIKPLKGVSSSALLSTSLHSIRQVRIPLSLEHASAVGREDDSFVKAWQLPAGLPGGAEGDRSLGSLGCSCRGTKTIGGSDQFAPTGLCRSATLPIP